MSELKSDQTKHNHKIYNHYKSRWDVGETKPATLHSHIHGHAAKLRELYKQVEEEEFLSAGHSQFSQYFATPRVFWCIIRLILIMYYLIILPLRFSFFGDSYNATLIIDWLIDGYFIIDTILQLVFFSTLIVEGGSIKQLKTSSDIFTHTISNFWMWCVIIAIIPYDIIFYFTTWKALNACRLIKALHVLQLSETIAYLWGSHRLFDFKISAIMLRILRIGFEMLVVAHWAACFWWYIGDIEYTSNQPQSWIATKGIVGRRVTRQYLISIYWSIVTIMSVGYGDYVPIQETEIVFAMAVQLFGWVSLGRIIGNLAPLMHQATAPKANFMRKMEQLQSYMRVERVNYDVQKVVVKHFQNEWDRFFGVSEDHIFKFDLPPRYRQDVGMYLAGNILRSVPFLHYVSEDFLRHLLLRMSFEHVSAGSEIIYENSKCEHMYIILHGEVEEIFDNEIVKEYQAKTIDAVFGHNYFLTSEISDATFRAKNNVELMILSRKEYLHQLHLLPNEKTKIEKGIFEMKKKQEKQKSSSSSNNNNNNNNNISDDNNLVQVTKQRKTPIGIISPEHQFKAWWNFFSFAFVIYYAMIIPFRITFWRLDWDEFETIDWLWFTIDWSVDSFFIIDIYLHIFHFALSNPFNRNVPITSWQIFMTHYLKGDFKWDLLAAIPLDVIELFGRRRTTWLLFLRLNKLLRMHRFGEYYQRFSTWAKRKVGTRTGSVLASGSAFALLRVLAFALVIVHWVGCLWYLLSEWEWEDMNEKITTWVIADNNLIDKFRSSRYIRSLYWAIVTASSVGYGGIVPLTDYETVFTIIVICTTCWMYTYVLGKLTTFAENLSRAAHEFENEMKIITRYSREVGLPEEVFFRIREHREFLWALQRDAKPRHPLTEFPPSLQYKLVESICSLSILKLIPIELQSNEERIRNLLKKLKPIIFAPEDIIGAPEQKDRNKIYILVTGEIRAYPSELIKPTSNGKIPASSSQEIINKSDSSVLNNNNNDDDNNNKEFINIAEQSLFGLEIVDPDVSNYSFMYEAHTACSCFELNVDYLLEALKNNENELTDKQINYHLSKVGELGILSPNDHATRVLRRPSMEMMPGSNAGSRVQLELTTPRTRQRKQLRVRFSDVPVVYDDINAKEPINVAKVSAPSSPTSSSRLANKVILNEHRRFRFIWEIIKVGGLVYFVIVVPLRIGFAHDIEWNDVLIVLSLFIDGIIDTIFLLDMFYFRRLKFVEMIDGELQSPKKSWKKYKKSKAFFYDLCATIIFDNIVLFIDVRIVFWLRLLRLLRLHRFNEGYRALEKYVGTMAETQSLDTKKENKRRGYFSPGLLRITRQLIILLAYIHFVGCFWYLVIKDQAPNTPGTPNFDATKSKIFSYVQSFYFVVTTISTVGFGDIKPITIPETYFGILLLLTGLILWAVFTANVASLVANYDAVESNYLQRVDNILNYLNLHVNNEVIKYRVKSYLEHLWQRYRGVLPENTLKALPTSLRKEAAWFQFNPYITSLDIFDGCDREFLRTLSTYFEYNHYLGPWTEVNSLGYEIKHFEYLSKVGEVRDYAIIIIQGIVDVTDTTGSNVLDSITVEPDVGGLVTPFVINEINLLTALPQRSSITLRARTTCEAIILHHNDVVEALKQHPEAKNHFIKKIQKSIKKKEKRLNDGLLASAQHDQQVARARTKSTDDYQTTMRFAAPSGPSEAFRQWWDLLCFAGLLFYLITSPAQAVFRGAENLNKFWALMIVSFLVDVFFIIDLVMRLRYFIPLEDSNRIGVTNATTIRQLYYKKWGKRVLLEYLGVFPLDWFVIAVAIVFDLGQTDDMQNWIGFYRINRLLLAHRYNYYLRIIAQHAAVNRNRIFDFVTRRVGKLILVVILGLHILACAWFILGDKSRGETWFILKGNSAETASPFGQYIYSLYWVVTTSTTVGYGDIYPVNIQEMLYFLMAILIGDVLYADIIGSMSMRVTTRTTEESKHTYRMTYLSQFMKFRRLPIDLRNKILAWHEHVFRLGADMESPIYMLPAHLTKRILHSVNSKALDAMPYLVEAADDDHNFLKSVCSLMYRRMYVAGDSLCSQGAVSDELLFLLSGEVAIYLPFEEDGTILNTGKAYRSPRYQRQSSITGREVNESSFYVESHHESLSVNDAELIAHWQNSGRKPLMLGANEVIGDMGFFSGDERSATVVAKQTVDALALNLYEFRQLLYIHQHHRKAIATEFVNYAADKDWIHLLPMDYNASRQERAKAQEYNEREKTRMIELIIKNLEIDEEDINTVHTEQSQYLLRQNAPMAIEFHRTMKGTQVDLNIDVSQNDEVEDDDDEEEKSDY